VQARGAEGRIFLASAITEPELRAVLAPHIRTEERLAWDAGTETVAAREEERLGTLLLGSRALTDPDPSSVGLALLQGVRRTGLECLPWTRRARDLRDRVLSLGAWRPLGQWPDLSDEGLLASLETWLGP
jgi:ATP-dependent helicase HrpB